VRVLPLLDHVPWRPCRGKILVAVLNFVGLLVDEPIVPDHVDLLVAELSQAQQEEVVVHRGEFASVVFGIVVLFLLLVARLGILLGCPGFSHLARGDRKQERVYKRLEPPEEPVTGLVLHLEGDRLVCCAQQLGRLGRPRLLRHLLVDLRCDLEQRRLEVRDLRMHLQDDRGLRRLRLLGL